MTDGSQRFQVDLAGMVDLLSRHLYSGPQVYLRELLQNGVDAITARRATDPAAPARLRLRTGTDAGGRPTLAVTDTGIGLTEQEATDLLATIGRSSKRDPDFGTARAEFLGQFGIGMLAAFMVADRLNVRSRSARPGARPVHWRGFADGTFTVTSLPPSSIDEDGAGSAGAPAGGSGGTATAPAMDAQMLAAAVGIAPAEDAEDGPVPVGTTITLTARPDMAHWLERDTVIRLATEYGALLPEDLAVEVPVPGSPIPVWRRISRPDLPWQEEHPTPQARREALARYCEETFGFTPLDQIDLSVPLAGVTGVAFVLPRAASPSPGRHRVLLKRMLLGPRVDGVLPDWAFFVRAVIDSDTLSPTASREQLHQDGVLDGVREALGAQILAWAERTLRRSTPLARDVIETHHLALRALALTDDDVLDLVAHVLPYQTTDGPMTLAQVAAAGDGHIRYATTTEAYQRVAAVARAQGLVVVNAGYVYDADIMARLARPGRVPTTDIDRAAPEDRADRASGSDRAAVGPTADSSSWSLEELTAQDLVQVLGVLDVAREMAVAPAVTRAREILEADDCDVIVRTFQPVTAPSILLRDPEGERRRDLDRERRASAGLWGGLLDVFAQDASARTRTLVLNDDAPAVRLLLSAPGGSVFEAGLRSLYLSAVMLAGDGLRASESADLSEALTTLLDASLDPPTRGRDAAGPDTPDSPGPHP